MLLLIMILMMILLIVCSVFVHDKKFTGISLLGIIVVVSIIWIYNAATNYAVINNAQSAFDVRDANGEKTVIYIDENGEYFYIAYNNWDVIRPKEKEYIPTEKIEKYLELHEEMQELNIFGNKK